VVAYAQYEFKTQWHKIYKAILITNITVSPGYIKIDLNEPARELRVYSYESLTGRDRVYLDWFLEQSDRKRLRELSNENEELAMGDVRFECEANY
jgi:hypothetical protein